jgi:RHS repeat-associated protein
MKTDLCSKLSKVYLLALLLVNAVCASAQSSITRESSFAYNAQGLLISEVVEPGNVQACLITTHVYDNFGNKTGVTTAACAGATGAALSSASTPRAASTTYTADGRFPAVTTNALGHSESKLYDNRFGSPTSLTGPNGLTTQWQYDGFGRKTRESRSDGTWSSWSYQLCTDAGAGCPGTLIPQGQGISAVTYLEGQIPYWVATEQSCSAANPTTCNLAAPNKRQYHDALNRVIRAETKSFDGGTAPALDVVQDTVYNSRGQIQRKSNTYDKANPGSAIWVAYTYDALGRLTKEEAPDAAASSSGGVAITEISYNGLSSTVKNSAGQIKTTTKDALGRTKSVTDAQGGTVLYAYDALGQLTQTNAGGNITTLAYNIRGQKTKMQDPAMGVWEYAYNAFGELVSQTDSLSKSSAIEYDRLGRMTKRNEPDLVSTWVYDTCTMGKGKLCQATSNNGYNRVHSYDPQGRPSSTSTVLESAASPAVTSVAYEAATGRVASKSYPTGYIARYTYTQLGYVKSVTGQGVTGTVAGFTKEAKYEVLAINAQGQITSYKYGNQVTTVKDYDLQTGRLKSIAATKDGLATGGIQQNTYTYDSLSNLTARADINTGVQETFLYDSLNRLTNYTAQGGSVTAQDASSNVQVRYDPRGNITYKSDVGQYWYDSARPNRLTNITLSAPAGAAALTGKRHLTYAFDDYQVGAKAMSNGLIMGNGNLMYTVSQDTSNNRHTVRWETYTSFNMPKEILFGPLVNSANPINTVASRTLTFVYGPEHQRIKQVVQLDGSAPSNMSAGTVYYLNGANNDLGYEKEIKASGLTEHKHYLSAGGMVFAMQVTRQGNLATGGTAGTARPAQSLSYMHVDHLGSVSVLTDDTGSVVERMAFDPWGKRRNINGMADSNDTIVGLTMDRGFTLHEHLDEMGIIHMNGRIFDPLIGRFMSADPFIQAPDNLQSHNRFAYVMNNPLSYTDPSGYFSLKKLFRAVFAIAVAWVTAGAIQPYMILNGYSVVAAKITAAAVGGFAGGLIASGGDLKAALQGAFTGGVFGGIGALTGGLSDIARIGAHAAGGCITSVASGGGCGSGALSGAFGKFTTLQTQEWGVGVAQFTASTIAGGIGSVLGGGKFENGAVTAAFGYLFNHCMSGAQCWRQTQDQIGKLATGIGNAFRDVAWALTPGSGAVDCLTQGCSLAGAALAAVDFVPGGKAVSLGERGLAHVMARHIAGGAESTGKSLFNSASDLSVLATNASAAVPVASGRNYVRVVDAGSSIGVDRATGQATSVYTVVTNRGGDVVTMHPGVPR